MMYFFRVLKVFIAVHDVEAKEFADDIYSSLKSTFGMDPEYIPVSDPPEVQEGIFISVGSSRKSQDAGVDIARMFDMLTLGDNKEQVDPYITSLTKVGIPVSTEWIPPSGSPPDVVRIDIGTRPFSETVLKLRHAPYPKMISSPDNAPAKAKQ